MTDPIVKDRVRAYFAAFQAADKAAMEALLHADFHFTSPFDDHIDRAAWFARCWPHAGSFRFRLPMTIFVEGDDAFVRYETEGKPGGTFRNAEFFRLKDGCIISIDVYFGFLPSSVTGAA